MIITVLHTAITERSVSVFVKIRTYFFKKVFISFLPDSDIYKISRSQYGRIAAATLLADLILDVSKD